MRITFVFKGDESYYSFHPVFLKEYSSLHRDSFPFGLRNSYNRETDMFSFLDSEISPSCLEKVITISNGDEFEISFLYNIDHIPFDSLEPYFIPLAEDLGLGF